MEKPGSHGKEKRSKAKRRARYSGSDDDNDEFEKIAKGSRRKKWYSSEECLSSGSESSDVKDMRERGKKKSRRRRSRKKYSSNDSSDAEESDGLGHSNKKQKHQKMDKSRNRKERISDDAFDDREIVRKEMGLEWMLRPDDRTGRKPAVRTEDAPPEASKEEEVGLF